MFNKKNGVRENIFCLIHTVIMIMVHLVTNTDSSVLLKCSAVRQLQNYVYDIYFTL